MDICPCNICPGNICPQYLSSYWPDLDKILKVGSLIFLPTSAFQTIQHFCSAMKGLVFKVNLALVIFLSFFIMILILQIAHNSPLLNLEALSQVILAQQHSSEKDTMKSGWGAGRPLLKPLFASRLATLTDACSKMDGLKRVTD